MGKGRAPRPKLPLVPCNSCGLAVVQQRRTSKSGLHFCKESECQRAKSRAHYERTRPPSLGDAPTRCAGCEAPLPARKLRHGEDPEERWCGSTPCRRIRANETARKQLSARASEAPTVRFYRAAASAPRIECPECHLIDALDGFPHRDAHAGPCYGLTDKRGEIHSADIDTVWTPGTRRYSDDPNRGD